ncbi:DUF192 domain-containing protein [Halorubrum kocurii]|uniref:DUF192 domain-containing protein n=1 Tax=Halorubrum kocurii JCM 14978 TaxID=1230456 RepID=M0NL00_9EURY|nr:DUF192 domain-containing protein [Halorubrum kocurii]EMA58622.1 hypothetical protein C468_15414 [Halorubrum kocurii JCM 14978]
MRRRAVLAAIGAASTGGIAGCGGSASSAGDGSEGGNGSEGGDGDGSDGDDGETDAGTDALPTDWPAGTYADYDATTVAVRSPEGEDRGAVRAAIAETREKRILGLSAAPSLPENAGMLFAYPEPRDSLTFIMPEMDFGIDIVYADADRTITRIHNAPEPGPNEDGSEQRYPGSGQYVLEVPYEWTDRRGVEVGDALAFEL